MSNFDDIKKKIQSLKNKKPENNISDNLNRIEMEINKDTLSMFKKNNNQQRSNNLVSEITLDNNNSNFVLNSIAQDRSFLIKTMKNNHFDVAQASENKQTQTITKDETAKEKQESILNNNNNNIGKNPFNSINEILCKSTSSDDIINKNNIFNCQVLNSNDLLPCKKALTKDYLSNDITSKNGTNLGNTEKSMTSLKRDKYQYENNLERNPNLSGTKIYEMMRMIDHKLDNERYIINYE